MRSMRALMASAALAVTLVGQPVSAAQTITVTNGVTVFRGMDDPDTATERRETRERAGVTVFRGNAAPYVPPPVTEPTPEPIISGGDKLWAIDPQTGEVVACYLQTTVYGDQVVRCTSN